MDAAAPLAQTGLIIKALGGFYYVRTPQGKELSCRARGRFRKDEISPVVGDTVTVEMTQPGSGYVVEIAPRKNSLIRPPVANLDRLAMVVSCKDPAPNLLVLDKLTAIACRRNIPVVLIFTKTDLSDPEPFTAIYRKAGFTVFEVNNLTGEGAQAVRQELRTGITAFCGNSGAGKSSLLNTLFPQLELATGDISQKLGRGRHTTRHVELFATGNGGWIADTPGFSAVEFLQFEKMLARELADCFIDFADYREHCRFTGCSHRSEKGCAVLEAVARDEIAPSRHQSYLAIFEELKDVKEWELGK
ncbi:MAG: ribosome small subunit-dependent GTPase A [Angelakisella sp.]|nr:ribosome small subunit-dependent GTPase A [Angelakisella sp.]